MDLVEMLGEDGETIKRIVEDDREEKAKRKGKQKERVESTLGVKFWKEGITTSAGTPFILSPLPRNESAHPAYRLLCNYIETNGKSRTSLISICAKYVSRCQWRWSAHGLRSHCREGFPAHE